MTFLILLPWIGVIASLTLAYYYRDRKFRLFFILSGLSDLISGLLWLIFSMSSQDFWIPILYLTVFSVNEIFLLNYRKIVLAGFIFVLILNYFATTQVQYYIVLLGNFYLLFIFLRYFAREIISSNNISVFYFLLVLYEVIIVLNFTALVRNIQLGLNVYYIGIIIQIIIKVYLIIIHKRIDKETTPFPLSKIFT